MNEIQKRELAVFKEVAKIFDKYSLHYFAIGGTCIGAIRHKGFIPWDDDIDIALPRKDYELFRTKYYKELPQYLLKLDCDNSREHSFLFTKIHDARTTLVDYYAKDSIERYTGAFVDIMPIDGLPQDKTACKNAIDKFKIFDRLNAKCRPVPLTIYNGSFVGFGKFIVKRIISAFFQNYYSTKVRNLGCKYNYKDSQKCIFTWRAGLKNFPQSRIVFPKYFFDETIEVSFEDTTMKIPRYYDEYLTQDFGDYMQMPPIGEQRTEHEIYICDMNTPFKFYAERDKKVYNNRFKIWRKFP